MTPRYRSRRHAAPSLGRATAQDDRRGSARRATDGQHGYVLLAALLTAAMGLAAAFAAFALAEAGGRVAAADGGAEKARSAALAGITDAADRLTWGGLPGLWQGFVNESFDAAVGGSGAATVVVSRVGSAATADPVFTVAARGTSGAAVATASSTLAMEALGLPRGITVAGDLRIAATLSVAGSGVYAGGDVIGRQHLTFCRAEGDAVALDHAHPDLWPQAAAHASGGIYGSGGEVHQDGSAVADDTDACTGDPTGQDVWPPSAESLALLRAHAAAEHAPASGADVDLGILATQLAASQPAAPQNGSVLVVRAGDGPVRVTGWWPQTEETPQLTLVVIGDAEVAGGVGDPGVAVHGALLVTGSLRVNTPLLVAGFLAAGDLLIEAPASVVVPADWRFRPPPGSVTAVRVGAAGVPGAPFGDSRRAGSRRTAVADGEGKAYVDHWRSRAVCAHPSALAPAVSSDACLVRTRSALTAVLSEVNTMVEKPVTQCRRLLAVRAAGTRGSLKHSCRVADVGAGMAKGRSIRGV